MGEIVRWQHQHTTHEEYGQEPQHQGNDADWELAQSYTLAVEELLNKAQEFEDENRDNWRRQLEKDIPDLDKNAREIQEMIDNE